MTATSMQYNCGNKLDSSCRWRRRLKHEPIACAPIKCVIMSDPCWLEDEPRIAALITIAGPSRRMTAASNMYVAACSELHNNTSV